MSYDEALEIMVKFKLDGKVIGNWYGELTKNKDNRLTREKFVIKLAEILKFLGITRNEGSNKGQNAFIKRDDILACINQYPRMITKDVTTLQKKCERIEQLQTMNPEKTNIALKKDIYLYSTGVDKIDISITILEQFWVITKEGYVINAAEYILIRNQAKLMISSQKLYYRLMFLKEKLGTVNIAETEFNLCLKPSQRFEPRYTVKDRELEKIYLLPEYDPENPQKFKQEIMKKIKEKENGKEHE